MDARYFIALIMLFIAPAMHCSAAAATQSTTNPVTATVKKIPLKEFESMRGKEDAVVLDVRTPKEFAAGHVPGAVNVDWHARDFAEQVGKLDKSKKYLVHCLGGVRSAAATKKMATLGFDQLFDYSGGWSEYSKAGKEVEK
jgi:phage shock protein E